MMKKIDNKVTPWARGRHRHGTDWIAAPQIHLVTISDRFVFSYSVNGPGHIRSGGGDAHAFVDNELFAVARWRHGPISGLPERPGL